MNELGPHTPLHISCPFLTVFRYARLWFAYYSRTPRPFGSVCVCARERATSGERWYGWHHTIQDGVPGVYRRRSVMEMMMTIWVITDDDCCSRVSAAAWVLDLLLQPRLCPLIWCSPASGRRRGGGSGLLNFSLTGSWLSSRYLHRVSTRGKNWEGIFHSFGSSPVHTKIITGILIKLKHLLNMNALLCHPHHRGNRGWDAPKGLVQSLFVGVKAPPFPLYFCSTLGKCALSTTNTRDDHEN